MLEDWYLNDLMNFKIRDTWEDTDQYLIGVMIKILKENSLIEYLSNERTIDEIMETHNYSTTMKHSIMWILERLTIDKIVDKKSYENTIKYKIDPASLPDINLDEIYKRVKNVATECSNTIDMINLIADNYKDLLNGKTTSVEILYSGEHVKISNYYYSDNVYYIANNIAGAKALNLLISQKENPSILEVGGGMGGGPKFLLKERIKNNLSLNNFNYTFTDIANKMLRAAKKKIVELTENNIENFNFQKFDLNVDVLKQGYKENSFDIIWGVNALHVSYDLEFSLKEIKKLLKPGGTFIITETVRPPGNPMIQQEFILTTLRDYWDVKVEGDVRPNYGFLRWSEWIDVLRKCGFTNVKTTPNMKYLDEHYHNSYVANITGDKK